MSFYDDREIQAPDAREAALFEALPVFLREIKNASDGWGRLLGSIDPDAITSRKALATLPLLRKSTLLGEQQEDPPFGGLTTGGDFLRVFMSPGPLWEPQGSGADPWHGARALFAAGIRRGDLVHNAFSYHMTPGGFIMDQSAQALGARVFPAGVGNTEMQIDAIATLRPKAYAGTPDFLKVLIEKAAELGKDISSLKYGLVSGGALFPSLREYFTQKGIDVLQAYATADAGIIAYESNAREGMLISEDMIVEIVRPGTSEPVAVGEVGEVVITNFNPTYPLVRFATGDLSAFMQGESPCGRTNMRLKGWMGRADQRTKVRGMFIDPAQIDMILKRHSSIYKARLEVDRKDEQDIMALFCEVPQAGIDEKAVEHTVRDITKLRCQVICVERDSLPNDGKVIADNRKYDE